MAKKKENPKPDGYFSKSRKKHFSKKVFFITIATIATILLVAGGASFFIVKLRDNENVFKIDDSSVKTADEETIERQAVVAKKVEDLVAASGPSSAQQYLNDEIENTNDIKEKAQLYISKSVLASSLPGGQDYSKALEYAIEADRLYPTEETALIIANIEENQNNIPTAIKYYNLYLDRIPKGLDGKASDDSGYDYYYKHINELESEM